MSDRDLKEGLRAAGYSFEEMWFYRQNQELLEELRKKTASEAAELSVRSKKHLRLILGGRSDEDSRPTELASSQSVKKAA
ncbi:MAG: hypothetical protein KGQ59_10700 [Bdellovibrionales bacterium]|nr:hypothetical protein [Bdellovibrionales bacterium]